VTAEPRLYVEYGKERALYWDLSEPLTGFGAPRAHAS
jgi:hypothetical protein